MNKLIEIYAYIKSYFLPVHFCTYKWKENKIYNIYIRRSMPKESAHIEINGKIYPLNIYMKILNVDTLFLILDQQRESFIDDILN